MYWNFQEHQSLNPSFRQAEFSGGSIKYGADPAPDPVDIPSIAISVRNLSKSYRMWKAPQDRIKQPLRSILSRWAHIGEKQYCTEFHALKDVSFDVKDGETVGVIGRNGSGKSTLLQVLAGIVEPTSGSFTSRGKVAALLELGSGFNPEFTGRENIYLNATIMGLSEAEIDDRYESIIEFADIADFIDQPIKTYSSGMYVRLAFAVAVSVEPDILLVDEALAVGDVKFQAKCFRKFEEIVQRGTSILFVTHSMEEITRRCARSILLEQGAVVSDGHSRDVVNQYMELMFGTTKRSCATISFQDARETPRSRIDANYQQLRFEDRPGYNRHEFRWGNREAEIIDFSVFTDNEGHRTIIPSGIKTTVVITALFHVAFENPIYGLTIKTPDGVIVYSSNSRDCRGGPFSKPVKPGEVVRVGFILNQRLGGGDYLLSVGVAVDISGQIVPLDRRYDSIHIQVENTKCRSIGLADFDMTVEFAS